MLTQLTVRNFKLFEDVTIELGSSVVFIGPNNSGKTTALQALALWDIGLRKWLEKRSGKETPKKRPGVTINRRDLISIPVPEANLLWRDLHVRNVIAARDHEKQKTENILIEIEVDGITDDRPWKCGLEFDFANDESFYCRPLRLSPGKDAPRMQIPEEAALMRLAFLPPMSGLAAVEDRLDPGAIDVKLGEGRTAEVLRNLCHRVLTRADDGNLSWQRVVEHMEVLFGIRLDEPEYIPVRGQISLAYRTTSDVRLDISSAGRGLQQTLLLLTHLAVNANSVLLLDEPDAHLEVLRQRQIYEVLTSVARENCSQLVAASHSEIILNEAADRDVVVAFLGRPHRIDDRDRKLKLAKSLKEVGFDQYYQAEQTGWVLYLEGSTDLAILQAFAASLNHPAAKVLERPFVHYIENKPQKAREHFFALRKAKPDLVGLILCDRMEKRFNAGDDLDEYMWQRREIENYLCQRATLLRFAKAQGFGESAGPLYSGPEAERRLKAMQESFDDNTSPAALKDPSHRWWLDTKASDDFLDLVFEEYYRKLELPAGFARKSNYHQLAHFVAKDDLSPEVGEVLDRIVRVSQRARPVE